MAPGDKSRKKIDLDKNIPDPLVKKYFQARELFTCKLPIKSILVKDKKSCSTSTNEGWNDFETDEVIFKTNFEEFKPLPQNLLELEELKLAEFPVSLAPRLKNEAGIAGAFKENVLNPMQELFDQRFEIEWQRVIGDFQTDFCLTDCNDDDNPFLATEMKWCLAFIDRPEAQLSNKAEVIQSLAKALRLNLDVINEDSLSIGKKIRRKDGETAGCYCFRLALKQLRARLFSMNKTVAFGILSSYCHTYFVILRRDEKSTLTVSPVVKYSDKDVLRKIADFVQLAMTTESQNIENSFTASEETDSSPDGSGEEEEEHPRKRARKDQGGSGDTRSSNARQMVSDSKIKHQAGSGKYTKRDILGEGRTGYVWQVVDSEGKKFAVKSACHFKGKKRGEMKAIIQELKNEKEIYGKLKDLQGVVLPLFHFSAYLPGSTYSLFLEELDATPIRPQDLPEEQKDAIVDALGRIHGKKILHGDIREENILLDRQNPKQVFFIDFGYSHECDLEEDLQREMKELKSLLCIPFS